MNPRDRKTGPHHPSPMTQEPETEIKIKHLSTRFFIRRPRLITNCKRSRGEKDGAGKEKARQMKATEVRSDDCL